MLSVTGHRPDKLGGYSTEAQKILVQIATQALEEINPTEVITGMALGWDQAIARACISLQIPFIAAVPFKGQECKWPERSQEIYRMILKKAERIQYTSPGEYAGFKLQVRNEWMVDHSDEVLAMWNGSDGGTKNCIEYAYMKKKSVMNVYSKWINLFVNSPIYIPTSKTVFNRERIQQLALELI